jgi:hypothetical protein
MMVIDNKFSIGDEVYLRTDREQEARLLTGLIVDASGILYVLACGLSESSHQYIEITSERDILKITTN